MIARLTDLFRRHREGILYLIFGVVTTLVNFGIYYVLIWTGMHYLAAQVIAWIGAVLVAYITNRRWVFESRACGVRAILTECAAFFASRLFSGAIETGLLWLMVDVAAISEEIAKWPVAVITVVLNYVTGKLIVFRNH